MKIYHHYLQPDLIREAANHGVDLSAEESLKLIKKAESEEGLFFSSLSRRAKIGYLMISVECGSQ